MSGYRITNIYQINGHSWRLSKYDSRDAEHFYVADFCSLSAAKRHAETALGFAVS